MTIQRLYNILIEDIVPKIEDSTGLSIFAHRRAKFEGWLKVELIDALTRKGYNALPEIELIDVSFDQVAIELKTLNTNIGYENVIKKSKPITKNVQSVIDDASSLNKKQHQSKFIVFVVFPITHDNTYWSAHLNRIKQNVIGSVLHREFKFTNGIPGVIYVANV